MHTFIKYIRRINYTSKTYEANKAKVRCPYLVCDFINILLALPLDINNAMYLEGGSEASFYLNHKGFEVKKFGSYETALMKMMTMTTFRKFLMLLEYRKSNICVTRQN